MEGVYEDCPGQIINKEESSIMFSKNTKAPPNIPYTIEIFAGASLSYLLVPIMDASKYFLN
jgi:hypothetical protein